MQHFGDQRADLAHLGFPESARGDGGRAQADAAGIQRRIGVEGNGVLVDGDARAVESLLGLFAADALGEDIDQQRCVSVPPETTRKPASIRLCASACAFATTCF